MRIFVSYRRDDSAGHAGRLGDALQARFGPDNVFIDRDDIQSGQNFVDVIQSAVHSSDALVAVIGREWLSCSGAGGRRIDDPDDFVRSEICAALERGIPTIPVLVAGASMPPAQVLPDALKPLAVHQALEITDDRWTYDVGRLAEALETLAGRPDHRRGRVWQAAAAAAVVVVLALVMVFMRTRSSQDEASVLTSSPPAGQTAADLNPSPAGASAAATPSAGSVTSPAAGASPAAITSAAGGSPPDARRSATSLTGSWRGDVTYSWGARYTERFTFDVDGGDVLGTASFLGTDRGIVEGTISGDSVRFQTRTQEVADDWNNPRNVVHRYRGTISGDTITFTMQSEGASSDVPVKFTVTRAAPSTKSQPRP